MEFKAFHNHGIQLTFSLITYIPASWLLAVLFLCMLPIAFCYLFMWLNLLRMCSPSLCPFFYPRLGLHTIVSMKLVSLSHSESTALLPLSPGTYFLIFYVLSLSYSFSCSVWSALTLLLLHKGSLSLPLRERGELQDWMFSLTFLRCAQWFLPGQSSLQEWCGSGYRLPEPLHRWLRQW